MYWNSVSVIDLAPPSGHPELSLSRVSVVTGATLA